MLSERQKKILKLIVESYIRQAKPVSSNQLCKRLSVLVLLLEVKWLVLKI